MDKTRFSLFLTSLALLVIFAGCNREEPRKTLSLLVPFVGQSNAPAPTLAPGEVYPPPPTPEPENLPSEQANQDPAGSATVTLTRAPTKVAVLNTTPTPNVKISTPDPPTPTLFWPTPVMAATATPYKRPAGAKGQTLPASRWKEWPVLPVVSTRARSIYKAGLAEGNDPLRFSKVGDCQVIRQYFLGLFDDPHSFDLGPYDYLQRTLKNFAGSFTRVSESVRTGFNVASVSTALYANPKNCKSGESPLKCEFRIWNPSIVIISMETWTAGRPTAAYESYLRQIVDFAVSHNVLPILATKADNKEGDDSINASIARVAVDYDIPLWNFWAAAQPLPDNGLLDDRFHLTNGPNFYESKRNLELGWPVRNLTALQSIDKVWQEVKK